MFLFKAVHYGGVLFGARRKRLRYSRALSHKQVCCAMCKFVERALRSLMRRHTCYMFHVYKVSVTASGSSCDVTLCRLHGGRCQINNDGFSYCACDFNCEAIRYAYIHHLSLSLSFNYYYFYYYFYSILYKWYDNSAIFNMR